MQLNALQPRTDLSSGRWYLSFASSKRWPRPSWRQLIARSRAATAASLDLKHPTCFSALAADAAMQEGGQLLSGEALVPCMHAASEAMDVALP